MASGDTLLVFTPLASEPPASAYATFDTHNQHPVLDFDDAAEESAVFSAVLPRHYGGSGLTAVLHWAATTVSITWTDAGDEADALGPWEINDATLANTDQWRLYWSLTVEDDLSVIRLYRAATKTPGDLVSLGAVGHAPGGPCTLVSCNGSGLNGRVEVAPDAAPDTDSGNTVTANRVKWSVAIERLEQDGTRLDSDSFGPAASVCTPPCDVGTSLRYTEILLADGAGIDGLLAGESFRLKVTRDADDPDDAMTGDAELCFVVVKET